MSENDSYLNYMDHFGTLMSGGATNMMREMLSAMSAQQKKQRNIDAGIMEENGLLGAPGKNIPFIYTTLNFENDCYVCSNELGKTVYTKDGEILFENCAHWDSLGQNMFIVYQFCKNEKGEKETDKYGSLYCGDLRLSEPVFRMGGMSSGFKLDFCTVLLKPTSDVLSSHCIIDMAGNVVLYNKKTYSDSAYLYGNIGLINDGYYNCFTGEIICEKDYHHMLETDDEIFIQNAKCVYRINKLSCSYEWFGQRPELKPEPEPIKKPVEYTKRVREHKATPPKPKIPGRNEPCACGSGKKFKNCCIYKK